MSAREGTYGYRRIQVILERHGVRTDGSTILSIIRDLGLQAAGPRAKVRTTVPTQDLDERPDLLRRDSRRRQARQEAVRRHSPASGRCPLLRQDVDRIRLSGDRSGLLY